MSLLLRSILLKTVRDQRWSMLIWSVLIVLGLVGGYTAFSQVDPAQFATLLQNPAFLFLNDPVAVGTAAGFVTFRYGFFFSLALSTVASVVGSRLIRGEELRGSIDLLLVSPCSRQELIREKVLGNGVFILAVGLAFAVGAMLGEAILKGPVAASGALLAGFDLSLLLFFYSMLALFISHYTRTPGSAAGIAGGLYAFFFILDASGRVYPIAFWIRSFSPNYYYGLSKPLIASYGTNVGAMAFLFALGLALLGGSIVVFRQRDVGGTGALPLSGIRGSRASETILPTAQIDRAARDPWLRSVLGRALRATSPALGWWTLGVFLYAAYGAAIAKSSAEQLQQALSGSPAMAQLFGAKILSTNNGFLSLVVFVLISIVAMLYALIRASEWPIDLDFGRLDLVLSTPQPRWRVALECYAAALIGFIVVALANAIGIVVAASATQLSVDAGRVFVASLALVPPMALIAGVVYALGARLRSGAVVGMVGAYLGVAFFTDLLRTALNLPDWVQHLSIFSAYGTPIVDGVNWISFSLMLVLAALVTVAGLYLFQTGDLRQGG